MSGKRGRVGHPSSLDLEHDRVMLSTQEFNVVRLTQSYSYATVADELDISESTVGTYRSRATKKLDEQVEVIKKMLQQQRIDQQEENIKEIAQEIVACLRDCGIDVEFEVSPESGIVDSNKEVPSARQAQTATETVEMAQGKLGDDHEYTKRIREYANQVIHGDEWGLSDVDLSKVTFETRTRARRRHGVASYNGDGHVTVGISEHTIENAGSEAMKETVRHELVHVWQYQHEYEKAELPNGQIARNIRPGHTGCWYAWERIMDVRRTNNHYSKSPKDYKYRIWCASCHRFVTGKHRLCKTVKCHSDSHAGMGWCGLCDDQTRNGNTFVVTDSDDEFYDNKESHSDW